MSKEQVNIVFSSDTQQARAGFNEIVSGSDRLSRSMKKGSDEASSFGAAFGAMAVGAAVGLRTINQLLDTNITKYKEYARLRREEEESGQSLSIEGSLSTAQAAVMNETISSVAVRRAAPSREFVRQVAEELLQVGMSPRDITNGGLESSVKILQALNEAKAGGSGTQLTRQLISNMQNLGIKVTPDNMERAAIQFNEIKQLTGLEFGPASNILESMARIGKSPRSVKALGGIGLKPEDIDPARVGIPGGLKALFDKTAGMPENQRNSLFARLFGDSEATGLARMFERRGDIRGGDVKGFERDAGRATSGRAAEARRADNRLAIAQAGQGDAALDFETELANFKAWETNAGDAPWVTEGRGWLLERLAEMVGREKVTATMKKSRESIQAPQKIQIEWPNKTRTSGHIKATEHLPPDVFGGVSGVF